jgi:hypothetical protein
MSPELRVDGGSSTAPVLKASDVQTSRTLRLVSKRAIESCDPPEPSPAKPVPSDPPRRTGRPSRVGGLRQQPSRSILTDYQRSGVSWQAVDREAVYAACDALARAGVEFTEALALMDLHAWIDRQQVKPHRYYAKRWGWGEKRAYRLMCDAGIYGPEDEEQTGTSREQTGTKGAVNEPENADQDTSREQTGTSRTQYPSSLSESPSGEEKTPLPPEGGTGTEGPPPKRSRSAPITAEAILSGVPVPLSLDTPAFRATWERWVRLRLKLKRVKEPIALFTDQLVDCEAAGEETAIVVLKASIRGEWQGLFFDRTTTNGKGNGSHQQAPSGKPAGSYERRLNLDLRDVARNLEGMAAGRPGPRRAHTGDAPGADATGRDPELEGRVAVEPGAGRPAHDR